MPTTTPKERKRIWQSIKGKCNGLTPEQHLIMRLYYGHGMSDRRIGEMFGDRMSHAVSQQFVNRTRNELKDKLTGEGEKNAHRQK